MPELPGSSGPRAPHAACGRAVRLARGIDLHELDLERELWPFAAGSFDAVLATEVLEHLAAPALFLTECRRALASGGWLLLTTPNVVDVRGRFRALAGRSPQSHLF